MLKPGSRPAFSLASEEASAPGLECGERHADAAADLDQRRLVAREPIGMHVGHGERCTAGRLDEHPMRIGKFQAGGNRLGIGHGDAFDRMRRQKIEDMLGNLPRTERNGDRGDGRQRHALFGGDGCIQRRGTVRLDCNHGNVAQPVAPQTFDDPGKQAATADAGDDTVEFGAGLHHFVDQGRMTFPEQRMIIGVDIGRLAFGGECDGMGIGFVEDRSMHENAGTGGGDAGADFRRGRFRHHDGDRHTERSARNGSCNAGIAAGGAENLARTLRHFVLAKQADAAQLEAAGGLQGVELQPERQAACAVVGSRPQKRCFNMQGRKGHGGGLEDAGGTCIFGPRNRMGQPAKPWRKRPRTVPFPAYLA